MKLHKNCENVRNSYSNGVSTKNRASICRNTVNINLYNVINSKKVTSNQDLRWLRITDCVLVVWKDMLLGKVSRKRLVVSMDAAEITIKCEIRCYTRMTKHLEVYKILIQSHVSGYLESRAGSNTGKNYHIDICFMR
jgi:hypothetical protein